MKRGFALLETIIVITFVTVSLLLLYGTFTSMVDNSKKNVLFEGVFEVKWIARLFKGRYCDAFL